ncbi:substrate-binding domain-containing protein [Agrobacterium cavarae]|uniref:substrate-binding domain-containing protein n=1 Tax=Agrobacterium cavarae TaxID=2528239 RepID=UPI0028A9C467|nr:substrate-binding domain-containing protein [Agrobacterium cavarae]
MAKGKLKSVDDVIYDDVVRISKPPAGPDDGQSTDAVSIGDVARMAGVAPITVSRALSKPQKVSAEKRARIQQAVEATGYRVNPFASALRSGRSNVVMAFASNMFSEQFSLALHACGNILEKAGYLFLVGQTAYSYDRETAAIRSLQALKPAAVMFTGVIELEENRDILKNLGIPIMETWALPRDPIDMLVGFSNTEAGLLAATELAEKGHRKVAYIGRRGGRGALRLQGFKNGCQKFGLDLVGVALGGDIVGPSDGAASLTRLLAECPDVEAIFCANDLLAFGCLAEARRQHIAVPERLAMIGFGDREIAAEIPPGLTMIGIDTQDLGRIAGEMILNSLSDGKKNAERTRRLPLRVIRRGSL